MFAHTHQPCLVLHPVQVGNASALSCMLCTCVAPCPQVSSNGRRSSNGHPTWLVLVGGRREGAWGTPTNSPHLYNLLL